VKLKLTILLFTAVPLAPVLAGSERDIASVYSTDSGASTASGAALNPGALTAAHRSLPFGSRVRITNRRNGRAVVATINDRGPFVAGRIIDLTPATARAVGISAVASVTVEVESRGRSAGPRVATKGPARISALLSRDRPRQASSKVVRPASASAYDEMQRAGFAVWTSEPTPVEILDTWPTTAEWPADMAIRPLNREHDLW
jgi:rare lipoprotein A